MPRRWRGLRQEAAGPSRWQARAHGHDARDPLLGDNAAFPAKCCVWGRGGASLEFKAIVIRDILPVVLPNVSGTNIAGSRMRFAHGQCQDFEEKNSAKSIRFSCERCKACLCVQLAGITRFSGLVGRCMQHGRFQTPDKIHEAKATCRR
jgi:hypothetical protein